jgi:glycosyltransferase involved in cell wall biosynthesis
VTGDGVALTLVPARPPREQTRDWYRTERQLLASAIRNSGADVVHGHWLYEFGAAAAFSGVANVVTSHDHPWNVVAAVRHLSPDRAGSRTKALTRNLARASLRATLASLVAQRAQILTAVAPSVAQHVRRTSARRAPIEVVPNGVVALASAGRPTPRDLRAPAYACIANGFDNGKNTSTAIRALQECRRESPGAQLHLIGRDHGPGGVAHRWASQHGLSENVQWHGELSHDAVLDVMRSTVDVLVHTSLREACSMAILEAHSLGIPVVGGARSGGVPFTLLGGSAGILVDVRDPHRVAHAMLESVEPSIYAQLSAAGVAAVRTTFNLAHVAEQYERLLARACDARL